MESSSRKDDKMCKKAPSFSYKVLKICWSELALINWRKKHIRALNQVKTFRSSQHNKRKAVNMVYSNIPLFTPEVPHFFQVIMPNGEAMRQDKLWIPRKFLREYGFDLGKNVQVQDPSGKKWNLELSRCDGKLWFDKRWKEFADYYSLTYGNILLFKYLGNSEFCIVIFDDTATEIRYPGTDQNGEVEDIKEDVDFEDTHKDFSADSYPRSQPKRKNSPATSSSLPPKKKKTSNPACSSRPMKNSVKGSEGVSANPKQGKKVIIREKRKMRGERKTEAIHKAADFRSDNPHFCCMMQPSYIAPKCDKLHLPFRFCKKNFDCSVEDEVQVSLLSIGKHWKMTFVLEKSYSRARLGCGWGKFVVDNNLQVGDVCVFELIRLDNIQFKVHIFPLKKTPADCSFPGTKKQVNTKKDAPRKIIRPMQSSVPFFEVVVKSSYINYGNLYVPIGFAREHLKDGARKMRLLVKDELWEVTYGKPNRMYGLSSFVKDNGVEAGDSCIFHLVGENVFRVDIQKGLFM